MLGVRPRSAAGGSCEKSSLSQLSNYHHFEILIYKNDDKSGL
jgi:hypothetical protein